MNNSIICYVSAITLAGRMLDMRTITRREFLAFEGKMREKYNLQKGSIYRDFRLIYMKGKL